MKKLIYLNIILFLAFIMTGCVNKWKKEFELDPDQPIADFSHMVMQLTPGEVVFLNHSLHAEKFHWDFGDGNTATISSPTHVYQENGTYSVTLIAMNDVGMHHVKANVIITNHTD